MASDHHSQEPRTGDHPGAGLRPIRPRHRKALRKMATLGDIWNSYCEAAALTGDPFAVERAEYIGRHLVYSRRVLLEVMTPEQVEVAVRLAKDSMRTHYSNLRGYGFRRLIRLAKEL